LLLRAKHLFVEARADRVQQGWPGDFSYFLDVIAGLGRSNRAAAEDASANEPIPRMTEGLSSET